MGKTKEVTSIFANESFVTAIGFFKDAKSISDRSRKASEKAGVKAGKAEKSGIAALIAFSAVAGLCESNKASEELRVATQVRLEGEGFSKGNAAKWVRIATGAAGFKTSEKDVENKAAGPNRLKLSTAIAEKLAEHEGSETVSPADAVLEALSASGPQNVEGETPGLNTLVSIENFVSDAAVKGKARPELADAKRIAQKYPQGTSKQAAFARALVAAYKVETKAALSKVKADLAKSKAKSSKKSSKKARKTA